MSIPKNDELDFELIDFYLARIEQQILNYVILNARNTDRQAVKTVTHFQTLFHLIHATRTIIHAWILERIGKYQKDLFNRSIGAHIASALGHDSFFIDSQLIRTREQTRILELPTQTTSAQNTTYWIVVRVEPLFRNSPINNYGDQIYLNIGLLQEIIPEITSDMNFSQIDFRNSYTQLGIIFQLMKLLVSNEQDERTIRHMTTMLNVFTRTSGKLLFTR